MSYRDKVYAVLRDAEQHIKAIIADALADQSYGDVAALASVAEELSALVRQVSIDVPASPAGGVTNSAGSPARRPKDPNKAFGPSEHRIREVSRDIQPSATVEPKRETYPSYLRDGDRLVKRAWSKKERQPYEHRAPRAIVEVLLDAIRKHRGDQRPFEAADVMPLYRSNGEEYPSYQSYLALGWLRHAGAIAKGREGYLLKPRWNEERIGQAWSTLPSVA
jgi:hypothetical protein